MKTNQFLKWLPSSLMLIGIGLWMNSLCFSPITNSYEIDLEKDWITPLEEGSLIIDSINKSLHIAVKSVVFKYPSNEIILNNINQILTQKEKIFQLLDEYLERSDTNTAPIIRAFEKENKAILYNIMQEVYGVTEEDIENVLSEHRFYKVDWSDNIELFIKTQKQQINLAVVYDVNFLATKVSSSCGPFYRYDPIIRSKSNVLKKGHISKLEVFLEHRPLRPTTIISNRKYSINGKETAMNNDTAIFKKTFINTNPQTLEIEYQCQGESFGRQRNVIDTIAVKENFIIYPIN
jgi:hypothetical protein